MTKRKDDPHNILKGVLTYGWVILSAIVVIGVSFVYSYHNGEFNSYKIYKNECENKTFAEDVPMPLHLLCAFENSINSLDYQECMAKLTSNCEKIGGELWTDKNFAWAEYCIIKNFTQEKQICNKTEVDEIEYEKINKRYDAFNVGKNHYYCSDYPYEWNNATLYFEYCYTQITQKILKEDITKEWLNENCEMARCTPCENLECKNQKCDLYYCGDYEVTV